MDAQLKQNVIQLSYRIVVAKSEQELKSMKNTVWDSGTVVSDSSQWVSYKGKELIPNTKYYWRVLVKTNCGTTKWSQTASWSTGLLDEKNWSGLWIGLDSLASGDNDTRHSRIASRLLRKVFQCEGAVSRATIHISGLGLYSLFINGKRVGNSELAPVPTDYTKTVAYDTYDITQLLSRRNAVGVTLAGGHYFAQTQNHEPKVRTTFGFPKLRALLIIEYKDGRSETISTDQTWKLSADSPVRYANEYDGELFDARRITDFSSPDYDDSQWMRARAVSAPGGVMLGNITPAMTVSDVEEPASVKILGRRMLVDFGTNNAGRIRLSVNAQRGDTIRIRHAELLAAGDSALYTKNLRSAEATAWFVSDGKPRSWAPCFTFYGFRYAEITSTNRDTDISKVIDAALLRRELIADEMDESGMQITFIGGAEAETLNKIIANARRGVRSNYKGMPIDCPQRDERMPWLGDRTTGSLGESYLMNNHSLYSKWLGGIRDSQREDGSLSDVAPAYWRLYNNNVTWPAALPFSADMLYRQYGDLKRNDVAFNIATTPDYPGWGYMVKHGATTIWELWNGDTADPSMNSGNHVMLLGDLLSWCYERLGGIRPDDNRPGFKRIILKPDFTVSKLNGVDAEHNSPYGMIRSAWQRSEDGITWHIVIPANTSAELHQPDGQCQTVGSGEYFLRFDSQE